MNRIVRENYPVADLPEDLREGLSVDSSARVVVEPNRRASRVPKAGFSLPALYAMAKPGFSGRDDIVDHITALRDEWNGR